MSAPDNATYEKASSPTGAALVGVCTRPEERDVLQPVQLYPLSKGMRSLSRHDQASRLSGLTRFIAMREMVANQRLEKLVWQWSDQLCGDLTQHILKDTLRLLNLRDIDEEFLKNIYVNKVRSHSTRVEQHRN